MAKILLVDDDLELSKMVFEWLTFEHHQVEMVHDGGKALDLLRFGNFDVVILDWDLPGMTGIEICSTYRGEGGQAPIIMLTAKSSISSKTEGLDSGSDDYLTKPFNMKELSSRVRALLRRSSSSTSDLLRAQDFVLDPVKYIVTKGGTEVHLPRREFSLLEFLMRHPDEVFSAEALMQRVWSTDSEASIDAIRTCMRRLRQKIGDDDSRPVPLIQTVHGIGYRLRK